jgi:hypothetical protein
MREFGNSALQSLGQRVSIVQFRSQGCFACSFSYYDANHAASDAESRSRVLSLAKTMNGEPKLAVAQISKF